MQEFSSISVSSYDAGSLADQLTEKSAEGWDVVAIVPAGTNVTAYLSRSADEVPAGTGHDTTGRDRTDHETTGASVDEPAGDAGEPADDEFSFTLASTSTPEAAAAETALAADADPAAEGERAEPVEPAGWSTEPEPAPDPAPADSAAATSTPAGTTATDGVTTGGDAVTGEVATTTAAADTAPAGTQAGSQTDAQEAAGAAPAGWYADPAGRYELRYWDGTQWTEHVSRAGQQYTDPPVA